MILKGTVSNEKLITFLFIKIIYLFFIKEVKLPKYCGRMNADDSAQ